MLNKKGVINMKRNSKDINQVALLRAAQESLNNPNTQNLNSDEWCEMQQILANGLDTNILFLNLSEREELIQQLEAGKMTNSQAERLAISGGRITSMNGWDGFVIGGVGDLRPSKQESA
jgi:hypothetical protein